MFERHGSEQYHIKYQQITTRFYMIFLVIALIIFGARLVVIEESRQETQWSPSELQYEQLEQTYSDQLSCLCSVSSMNYSTFITINISFHQICSSDFVSERWILYNSETQLGVRYFVYDYRTFAASQFRLLGLFCEQAQQIVKETLQIFDQTPFFSTHVIPKHLLESRTNVSINSWYYTTLTQFLQMIKLFRATSHGNLLISGVSNVAAVSKRTNFREMELRIQDFWDCSCALSPSCVMNTGIYETQQSSDTMSSQPLLEIPNFFTGCFPIEALLKSSLECYYHRSCMMAIDNYLNTSLGSSFNFSALDENLTSPNETIESIIDQLMLHSWSSTISYSSYYQTCAPRSCTYESMGRSSFFSVILTTLGIYGGLSLSLKLLCLIVLRCFEKMANEFSFHGFRTAIKNICHIRNEYQIIRRLHAFFLLIALYFILMFSAYTPESVTIHIDQPSLSRYQQLSEVYPHTLQCACSQISIPYQSFLSIQSRFHHLCASDFVSPQWIEYLYGRGNLMARYRPADYQLSSTGQFLLLSSLCRLAQETVNDSLQQLLTSNFISSQVLSSKSLNQDIQAVIDSFQLTMPNAFLNVLDMIREMTGSNMLMSGWSTNWYYITENVIIAQWAARTAPVVYQECDCGSSWKCTQPSGGMMAGCYPLEALLQTTLHCFYDQDCIDVNRRFTKLDMSTLATSRYSLNSTIESMLRHLMVEEYQNSVSYAAYFSKCAPASCTYSYIISLDATETAASLISLYGGLFILTRCLAVIITKMLFQKTNQVHPQMIESTT